ncbi:hypothetical protein QBC41DRAFT_42494 [Cercophora samala]|uniref:Uncharacterized protein n=1 Tax=Cercophora samala TaxID=330535 RepID=A0AA39ZIY3_9PEZI|nr:hypothetical protein QBC41DRAFT_42494 [Cercophora samala]
MAGAVHTSAPPTPPVLIIFSNLFRYFAIYYWLPARRSFASTPTFPRFTLLLHCLQFCLYTFLSPHNLPTTIHTLPSPPLTFPPIHPPFYSRRYKEIDYRPHVIACSLSLAAIPYVSSFFFFFFFFFLPSLDHPSTWSLSSSFAITLTHFTSPDFHLVASPSQV